MPVRFLDEPREPLVPGATERSVRFLDEPQPPPSQFFQQGLAIEGPANVASLGDLVLQFLAPRLREGRVPLAEQTRRAATEVFERGTGRRVAEPVGIPENILQAAGAGVTESVPFMGLPTRGRLLPFARRALVETGTGVGAEVARAGTEAVGGGPGAQIAASMLVGGLSRPLVRLGAGAGRVLIEGAVRPVRNAAARRIAAEVIGREVRDRAEALRLVDDELAQPLFGRATLDQILDTEAPGISGIVKRTARDSDVGAKLRADIAELRSLNALAAVDTGRSQFAAGSDVAAQRIYAERLAKIQAKVTRAYNNVEDLGGIPTRKLKAMSAKVRLEAGDELANTLPRRQLGLIEGYGDEVRLNQLKRLRTSLANDIRKEAGKGPRADAQRLRHMNRLVDAVEETFDEVAVVGGSRQVNALRRARTLRAIQGRFFDPKDPLNRILGGELEDTSKAFAKFLRSDRPVESLTRLRRTLGGNPEAWGGVQKLMRDHVFGEDFVDLLNIDRDLLARGGTNRVLSRLLKNRQAFDAVYGPGSAENARRFIMRARQLSTGVVGKVDEFAVTGSNVAGAEKTLQQAELVAQMAAWNYKLAGIKAIRVLTGSLPQSMEEADILIAKAMTDPQLARGFLQVLTPSELTGWQARGRAFLAETTRGVAGAVERPREEQ